jgi:hypothetical protein
VLTYWLENRAQPNVSFSKLSTLVLTNPFGIGDMKWTPELGPGIAEVKV